MSKTKPLLLLIVCTLLITPLLPAAAQAGRGQRVNNLKVLSDKVEDVSTPENILRSFLKPGMSQEGRAKALWKAVVKYRHQAPPPNEYLAEDWEAHDPVKIFNVYGYCQCCCASALIAALNRLDGREARGRILTAHSVPEVFYNDSWHMFDSSLITYFPKAATGAAASVDEIARAVTDWLKARPEYRGSDAKLRALMQSDGWSGWKQGPALLNACPFLSDSGWFPARTHGWYATMQEYDRQSEIYEYGYQLGHRALFSLRPGESLTREAGNRGLHINGEEMPEWDGLKAQAPAGDLAYLKEFFPGYRGGLVANGIHRYAPDLTAGGLAAGAETYANLTVGKASPLLRPRQAGRPGVAVVEMASPYVILGGSLKVRAVRRSQADRVALSISTNNGRSFAPLWSASKIGVAEAAIDLKPFLLRRYACRIKIEIAASAPGSAGLDSFLVENVFQHAPRTLPLLGPGKNAITVAADGDPGLASRAFACRITPDPKFARNETARALGVTFDNLDVQEGGCWWKGGVGAMTVPIETPGDLAALHFGAHIRARGEKDTVKMLLSFDDGATWAEAARITGPTPATTRYFRCDAVPPKTRRALLRYELSGSNTVGIFSFRADADYRDPLAAKAVPPFQVVHRWKEQGQEKSRRVTIDRLPFSYAIETQSEPEMVSVTYAMPAR